MSIVRNAKKKDFTYYLTNLDWGDGSEIDRSIKNFDRNDVFDHNYEKPGFYSISGLVYKFERVMIELTPPQQINMSADYEEITDNDGKKLVKTKQDFTELSSSLSNIEVLPGYEDKKLEITHKTGVSHNVRMGNALYIVPRDLPPSWLNTIIAPITNAPAGTSQNGIAIQLPIKMDISNIDVIYYSFEVNLANPNGEDNPSEYAILERSNPPSLNDAGIESYDGTIRFNSAKFIMGMGGNSNDPNRDLNVKDGGWQTVSGYIFVQEPPSNLATNGSDISDLNYQIGYSQIMIFPRRQSDTPQDEDGIAYIGLRNLTIRTPNTENIIRPNEWQRFYSNFIVNPRDDYESPLYEMNDFAMIGGVSKKSSHFKTLTALASFDKDNDQYRNNALESTYNPYDFISIYDTMAKYDHNYYNQVLDPYTNPIYEDYSPYWRDANDGEIQSLFDKKIIHGGIVDRDMHGILQNTELIDVDLSTTKVSKGVLPMWVQLGLDENNNVPDDQNYWQNIIPKEYKLTDRGGFSREPLEDPTKGSLTPRIPRLVWIIDEDNDQNWNGGYYWPQLPKMTKGGVFSESVDVNQYGDGIISSEKPTSKTLLNINFDVGDVDELQDITNNYIIQYKVDGVLDLDENGRVELLTEDVTDTLELDFDRQAF